MCLSNPSLASISFCELTNMNNEYFYLVIFGENIGSWSTHDWELSSIYLFNSISIQTISIGSFLVSTCSKSLSINNMASNEKGIYSMVLCNMGLVFE